MEVFALETLQWLLDSDPSLRWQVMRYLTGSPAEEVAAERARGKRIDAVVVQHYNLRA